MEADSFLLMVIYGPCGHVILTRSLTDNPLAQGFNITQGSVNVTVPNVPPRNDYIIVCECRL